MTIKNKSRIFVFFLTYAVWLALTGLGNYQEIIGGLFIALLVSLIAGHFFMTSEVGPNVFRRIIYMIYYILVFFWEMIKANLNVAYLVLHPMKPIKPGIVKIKTTLKKDSTLSLLCNSITLTPGTMTVDLNSEKQEIYIHWIYVKSTTVEGATREISDRFEKVLKKVFE